MSVDESFDFELAVNLPLLLKRVKVVTMIMSIKDVLTAHNWQK